MGSIEDELLDGDENRGLGPRERRLFPLAVAVLAAASSFLTLFATSGWGVNYTPDSLKYIWAARTLVQGQGFLLSNGQPYAHWPPGFPAVLAIGIAAGADVLAFTRMLHALVAALIVIFTAVLGKSLTRSVPLGLAAGALAALSPAMLANSAHVWSEPLFILLELAAALALARYFRDRSLMWLAAAGLAAAAACLQRYVGIVFVGALLAPVALLRDRPILQRLRDVALLGAFSLGPLGAWALRNVLAVGSPFGVNVPSDADVAMNVRRLAESLATWVLPATRIRYGAAAFALLSVAVVAVLVAGRRELRRWSAERRALLLLSAAFAFGYPLFLGVFTLTSGRDINERVLSPAAGFFHLLLIGAAALALRAAPSRRARSAAGVAVVTVLLLATVAHGARSFELAPRWRDRGVHKGYSTRAMKTSPMYRWLMGRAGDGAVFSNLPRPVIELLSDGELRAGRFETPRGRRVFPSGTIGAYYAYFESSGDRNPWYRPEALEGGRVRLLAEFADGRVYAVETSESPFPE